MPLPVCSKRLVLALIEQVNTGAALEVLPMVTTSPEVVAAAIAAAAQRRSLQGVRALLTHAREAGASRGVAARPVWCAVIMALGALRRPHQARKAFADMRDAGAWQPGDTTTVNLLLNALAGDIALQFTRWGWAGGRAWVGWLAGGAGGGAGRVVRAWPPWVHASTDLATVGEEEPCVPGRSMCVLLPTLAA